MKWLEAAIEERKKSLTNEQRDEFDLVKEQGNNSEDDVDLSETDMKMAIVPFCFLLIVQEQYSFNNDMLSNQIFCYISTMLCDRNVTFL